MIYSVKSSTEIKHALYLKLQVYISYYTLRTAVSVEKTADKRIELKAAIHCH